MIPPAAGTPAGSELAEPPAAIDQLLVDRIAAAAVGCPGVAGLASGPTATYLPGRIVPGIAIHGDTVAVAVVASYGRSLPETAQQVRDAVRRVAPELRVDVEIDDIALPNPDPEPAAAGTEQHPQR